MVVSVKEKFTIAQHTPTAHPTRRTIFPSGGTFLYLLRPQRNKALRKKRKEKGLKLTVVINVMCP